MREFVVFYAWQSDTVQRFNRFLIRIALNLAAKNISDDTAVGVRVRIDADTEGVLGHCPVTETILKKIAGCDAFVPDLTFVASTEASKLIPNPNVMLEYGYALRAKSFSVMIPVMNAAYGPPEELPFDMGHLRHPLIYNLPAAAKRADRRAVRKMLTNEFEAILRLMVAKSAGKAAESAAFKEAASIQPGFFFSPATEAIASFGFPGEQEYSFEGEKAIYLRLFPKTSEAQPKVGRSAIKTLVHNRRLLNPMANVHGGVQSSNSHGWVSIDPTGATNTKGISQAFPSGELWGVNSQVFQQDIIRHFIRPEEVSFVFGAISAEKIYTRALENFVALATTGMQLRPPFIVELGIVGTKGVYMGAPHPETTGGHYYGPIHEDSLVRRYELVDVGDKSLREVLRQFFDEVYDLAECSRSEILTDKHVQINDLPPRS